MRIIKERDDVVSFTDLFDGGSWSNHRRKEGGSGKVGEESREEGRSVGYQRGDDQHFSGFLADVGNGRGHESENDEWDDES